MAQEQISQSTVERRCPNCGTRVARDADSCFMCGHDLRVQPRRRQRVSWIDALLVIAVLLVLVLWWRLGSQPEIEPAAETAVEVIPPDAIPVLADTPTPTPTPVPTPTPIPPEPEQVFATHEVRPGETLLAIAGIYGVTVEQIQSANNLDNELIRVGDELVVPVLRTDRSSTNEAPIVSEFSYTVQSGDTIFTIASRFGGTVQDILEANGLSATDLIRPDDVLVIPVREVPQEVLDSSVDAAGASETTVVDGPPDDDSTIYIEPRLLGPPNRVSLAVDEPALLRWISVDVLEPNEWYVLLVYPVEGAAQNLPSIWTKATSYRLDADFAPVDGDMATYAWQVSVVRVQSAAGGERILEAASPSSAVRTFTWE